MAKTKVLHIISSLCIGGIERMAVSLCNDLNKDQFDVTLLVLSNHDNRLKDLLNSNVKVLELASTNTNSGVKEIFRLFFQRRKIENIIDTIDPDIIHTHIFFYTVVPILIAMRKVAPRAQHFHTIHTAGLHYASNKRSAKIRYEERWFKKNNTTIICVSKEVQRRIKILMPNIYTFFVPNYVSFEITQQIEKQSILKHSETIRIVYLARLAEGKNHSRLLEAFAIVVKNYPNAQLRLIGDGELSKKLKNLATDLNIERYVEFIGHSTQIQELLQHCDVGVFPSEYEGFSIALLEMMSVGLPLVCSDIATFHDLSMRDNDMLYFDPYDKQDIAAKLQLIIKDDDLRVNLSVASKKISTNYTKGIVIPQYEQLYGTRE